MKNINKILAVSVIAMLAVPAAQAKIVSETMLSSEAGHYSGTHTVQSEINTKLTANEAITAGTGTKITYDAKGLVTGSANLSASDIPTLTTGKISGLDTALSGKEVTSNKSTSANAVADSTGANKDTKYPTVAGAKAIAEAAVSGASGNYVPTSRTVNSKALSDNITLDGSDVKVKTGYAKKTGSVAAGDTIDTAIGKLETKADNAATAASNAATAAAAAQTTADGKVTANADITASGNSYKIVQYDKKGLVTAGKSLEASDIPTLPESKITNLTTDLAAKQTTANMVTDTEGYNNYFDSTKTEYASRANVYPNLPVVDAMIANVQTDLTSQVAGKIDKIVAADANKIMVRNNTGTYVPSKGSAITVANDGTLTVNTATKATQDGNGKNIANTYATQSALTTTNTNVSNLTTRVGTAEGNITANANKIGSGTISAKGSDGSTAAADLVSAVNAIDGRLATATSTASNAVAKTDHTKNRTLSVKSDGSVVDGTVSGSNGVSASVNDSGNITVSGNNASTSAKGVVQLADSAAISSGTAGRVVDAAQLKTVADSVTSTNNDKQDKLGGTAGKLVVTTATAGTVAYTDAVPTGIPATPSKDGVFVLTAKNDNGTTTFYWEDIGR